MGGVLKTPLVFHHVFPSFLTLLYFIYFWPQASPLWWFDQKISLRHLNSRRNPQGKPPFVLFIFVFITFISFHFIHSYVEIQSDNNTYSVLQNCASNFVCIHNIYFKRSLFLSGTKIQSFFDLSDVYAFYDGLKFRRRNLKKCSDDYWLNSISSFCFDYQSPARSKTKKYIRSFYLFRGIIFKIQLILPRKKEVGGIVMNKVHYCLFVSNKLLRKNYVLQVIGPIRLILPQIEVGGVESTARFWLSFMLQPQDSELYLKKGKYYYVVTTVYYKHPTTLLLGLLSLVTISSLLTSYDGIDILFVRIPPKETNFPKRKNEIK